MLAVLHKSSCSLAYLLYCSAISIMVLKEASKLAKLWASYAPCLRLFFAQSLHDCTHDILRIRHSLINHWHVRLLFWLTLSAIKEISHRLNVENSFGYCAYDKDIHESSDLH